MLGRYAILAPYEARGPRALCRAGRPHGIVEVEGDTALGRWLILEFLQWEDGRGGQNVGRYRDAYVRGRDGEWRFARRQFHGTYLGPADLSGAP